MSIFSKEHLHRSDKTPDWEKVPVAERTAIQQRAADTNGWDTPGNRETAKGAAAMVLTLMMMKSKNRWITAASPVPMIYSRWKDVKDGLEAARTNTRSEKGKKLDGSVDVASAVGVAVVGHSIGMLDTVDLTTITAQKGLNSVLNIIAEVRGRDPQPGRMGKYGTFVQWSGLATKAVGYGARLFDQPEAARVLNRAGSIILHTGTVMGTYSTVFDYAPAAFGPSDGEQPKPQNEGWTVIEFPPEAAPLTGLE